jgi:hypothetical protein
MSDRYMLPVRDGEIIRILRELQKSYPALQGNMQIEGTSFQVPLPDNEDVNAIQKSNGYSISSVSMGYGQSHISYSTSHGQPTSLAKFITRHDQNSGGKQKDQLQFHLDCAKEFVAIPLTFAGDDATTGLAGFKKIETALSGAVSTFAELQKAFLLKNEELRQEHQTEVDRLRASLEADRERLEAEIEKKRGEILEVQKQLDDRSNTHARRDIRQELKTAVSSSLSGRMFSDYTDRRRRFVRNAYLVTLIALFSLAAYLAYALGVAIEAKAIDGLWMIGLKSTVASISFIGLEHRAVN